MLHVEYGIVVYPSAFTESFPACALGSHATFTELYRGHVGTWPSLTRLVRSANRAL